MLNLEVWRSLLGAVKRIQLEEERGYAVPLDQLKNS